MDFNTGLFGPIVVVNPAYLVSELQQQHASPCDVDEEVFVALVEQAEANSVYYKYNLHKLFGKKYHAKYREQEEFGLGNTKRSLNGYMYGSLNSDVGMEFKYHTKIRWNVLTMNTTMSEFDCDDKCQEKKENGQENDKLMYAGPATSFGALTVNWGAGNSLVSRGGVTGNSFTLDVAQSTTFDMIPTQAGTFRFWVSDYDMLGMVGTFDVYDDGSYTSVKKQSSSSSSGMSGGAAALITIGTLMLLGLIVALVVVVKRPDLVGLNTTRFACIDDSTAGLNMGNTTSDAPIAAAGPPMLVCTWCGDSHINGAQNCTKMMTFLKANPQSQV
jgi:hypothetical protein